MNSRWMAAAGVAALSLLLSACGGSDDPTPVTAPAPTAQTTSGTVEGALHSTGTMKQFLGIPYAAPPVGSLRWAPPTAPATWTGTRSATTYGSHCPQRDTSPMSAYGTAGGQEDCLYLNVFTPTTPGPHPVLVWIHGGAFQYGRGLGYTPLRLTQQGVVVVTLNYRLGALGFLAHPALNISGRSGNYGVMDQTFALRWVQNNIANFGGNPGNVTVAGQSAGAASVYVQLASAQTAGLFHKAIVQSGPLSDPPSGAAAQTNGTTVAASRYGCASTTDPAAAVVANCLRNLSAAYIVANQPTDTFSLTNSPNVDGNYLVQGQATGIRTSTLANRVPVLIGSTLDEFTSLLASEETATNNASVTPGSPASSLRLPGSTGYANLLATDEALAARFAQLNVVQAGLGTAAAAAYPASNFGGVRPLAYARAITDRTFACATRSAARGLLGLGQPVYAYEFADTGAPMVLQAPVSFSFGAYHAAEIQYIFDLPSTASLTAAQRTLADRMATHWANFVKTSNPNSAGGSEWPAYSLSEPMLRFAPGAVSVINDFDAQHRCTTLWTPPPAPI